MHWTILLQIGLIWCVGTGSGPAGAQPPNEKARGVAPAPAAEDDPTDLDLDADLEEGAEAADADRTSEALRLMAEGMEALRFGDLKVAKRAFSGALKLDRRLPMANFAMGLVYHLDDDFRRAVVYYKRETQNHPACGEAYLNWGACEAEMNRHPAAVLAFVDAIRRLGAQEEYVNNLGKTVTELRRDRDDDENMTAELRRALQTYDDLEASLDAKLRTEGMARWGATKITVEEKRDIDEQNLRYEQMVQDQVLQLNAFVFEVNTVRTRINQVRMSLKDYNRIKEERSVLEAELARLELRLRDLQDNIRLAEANIQRLEAQKPQPPWNEAYTFIREVPSPNE